MTSLCLHTSKSIAVEDRKLLTRISRLMRDGRTPNIVFTQDTVLDRKRLNALADIAELAARHGIKPQTEHFPMSRLNDALDHLRAGKARYRVVLDADFEQA